jgi:hypothetical protein
MSDPHQSGKSNLNPKPYQSGKSDTDPHQSEKSVTDPHQSEKSDTDPHKSEKSDTDPYLSKKSDTIHIKMNIGIRICIRGNADPQHWCYVHCNFVKRAYLCSREGRFTAVHIGMFAVVTLGSCTVEILSISTLFRHFTIFYVPQPYIMYLQNSCPKISRIFNC